MVRGLMHLSLFAHLTLLCATAPCAAVVQQAAAVVAPVSPPANAGLAETGQAEASAFVPSPAGDETAEAAWVRLDSAAAAALDRMDDAMLDAAARAIFDLAVANFASTDPRLARSHIYMALADAAQGRASAAEDHLLAARDILDGREDLASDRMFALTAQLGLLAESGDFIKAAGIVEQTTALSAAMGDTRPDLVARLTLAEGNLLHAQGNYVAAIDRATSVIAASVATLGFDHPAIVALSGLLARGYVDTGKPALAEPLLRQIIADAPHQPGLINGHAVMAAIQLSSLLAEQGSIVEAEDLAKSAMTRAETNQQQGGRLYVAAIENMATIYHAQHRYGAAVPIMERAVELRNRLDGALSAAARAAQLKLSGLYAAMGRYDEAEMILRAQLASTSAKLGADHPSTVTLTIQLATLLVDMEQGEEAAGLFAQALPGAETLLGRVHPTTMAARYGLAMLAWRAGDLVHAEQQLTSVWQDSLAGFGAPHPATLYYATALANLRLSDASFADRAVEPAAMIADALRSRRHDDVDKSFAQVESNPVFRQATPNLTLLADALWQSRTSKDEQSDARAIEALQDAMAGGADQAVLRTAARRVADSRSATLGDAVRDREAAEATLEGLRQSYEALPADGSDDAIRQRQLLDQAVSSTTQLLTGIDARIREGFPEYFSLIRPEAVPVDQIAAALAEDEAILMIVPTDFGTHIVAISRGARSWQRATLTAGELRQNVRRLLYDAGAPVEVTVTEAAQWQEEGGRGYPFNRRLAWSLYQSLVAPMAPILDGKRHVFLVAAGAVGGLPLSMLVTEEPTGEDGNADALRATSWLADRYALVQIPTIQSLTLQRRAATETAQTGTLAAAPFAGFGDPLLRGEASTRGGGRGALRNSAVDIEALMLPAPQAGGARLANPAAILQMARLPGTAIELTNMRIALNAPESSVHLGAAATETSVRSADLSSTAIIALATHGLMAGEMGGNIEPGLVFTPPDEASKADDGLLTTSEIAELQLDAQWVILSACNTAAGDGRADAPGLSGLAQAFFFAGAQTLLASHWPVRDDVASIITVRTIEIQRDNPALSRAEAFQRAMREIRLNSSHDTGVDTWAHPNAWAPFTLIGDGAR